MDNPFTIFGGRPVIGRIAGTKLRARKRIWYRNSFQTQLTADLAEQAGQTTIRCRFSMHPLVTAFMAVWFGGVVLTGSGTLVMSLVALAYAQSGAPPGTWLGILIPTVMLVFAVGLLRFGRYLARDEQQFLLAFVRDTLGANLL